MAVGAILGQKPQIPQPVDTVQQGNMNAVTSNAVYEAIQAIPLSNTVKIFETSYSIGVNTQSKTIVTGDKPYVLFAVKIDTDTQSISENIIAARFNSGGFATLASNSTMSSQVYYIIGANDINWAASGITINNNHLLEVGYTYKFIILCV